MGTPFSSITELPGQAASLEQLQRACNRYLWAAEHCRGGDVLEIGCGAGPGLGLLARAAKYLCAGDCDQENLRHASNHYGARVALLAFDAEQLPFANRAFDVVVIMEVIYLIRDIDRLLTECSRVLRRPGKLIIVTANKDLYDFHPSLFSQRYYGTVELSRMLAAYGFEVMLFGDNPVSATGMRQKVTRPAKWLAVRLNLIPGTMDGKKWLKRIVFGKLVPIPRELTAETVRYQPPRPIASDRPDREHKVLFCMAELKRPDTVDGHHA